MSEIKVLNFGDKFAHASVGALSGFAGKLFLKDAIASTSCEVSFGSLVSCECVPFFHSHKENEETYIILSGVGRFQVDDNVFDIAEGSVVRVATGCDRNIKCTSDQPLVYICIQVKEGSLCGYTMTDAEITQRSSLL
ncbi:MAG: cupin domain-containing protein [Lepagella sp.]